MNLTALRLHSAQRRSRGRRRRRRGGCGRVALSASRNDLPIEALHLAHAMAVRLERRSVAGAEHRHAAHPIGQLPAVLASGSAIVSLAAPRGERAPAARAVGINISLAELGPRRQYAWICFPVVARHRCQAKQAPSQGFPPHVIALAGSAAKRCTMSMMRTSAPADRAR